MVLNYLTLSHPIFSKMGDGGGWHWLVQMEWCPAGWSVCLPLLIFPCTIKVQKFSSSTGSPGLSRKKGRKTVVVVVVILYCENWKACSWSAVWHKGSTTFLLQNSLDGSRKYETSAWLSLVGVSPLNSLQYSNTDGRVTRRVCHAAWKQA